MIIENIDEFLNYFINQSMQMKITKHMHILKI